MSPGHPNRSCPSAPAEHARESNSARVKEFTSLDESMLRPYHHKQEGCIADCTRAFIESAQALGDQAPSQYCSSARQGFTVVGHSPEIHPRNRGSCMTSWAYSPPAPPSHVSAQIQQTTRLEDKSGTCRAVAKSVDGSVCRRVGFELTLGLKAVGSSGEARKSATSVRRSLEVNRPGLCTFLSPPNSKLDNGWQC